MSGRPRTCGDAGGLRADGTPCKREVKEGRCKSHAGQVVLAVLPRTQAFDPEQLHAKAYAIWDRYQEGLPPEKLAALELMCMTLDQAFRSFAQVQAHTATVPDTVHAGNTKTNPAWRSFREAQSQYRAWVEHFGDELGKEAARSGLDELRAMA